MTSSNWERAPGGERRRRIVSPDAVRALHPISEHGSGHFHANRDDRRTTQLSIQLFVARERPRVEVWPDPRSMTLRVRVYRRDGTRREVAATLDALQDARGGPLEVFRGLLRGDALDQAAVVLIAGHRIKGLAGDSRPTWLTVERVRRVTQQRPYRGPPRQNRLAPANPNLPFYRPR